MEGQDEDGMESACTSATKLTYADLCQMPEDGLRHVADLTRTAADTLTTPLLPGFACALDVLFR
jgi:hypothetical protein